MAGPPGADRAGACGPGLAAVPPRRSAGCVRIVVAVVAGLGVLASATEAVLMASDARAQIRVYFGTDTTRAQALLVGAAGAAGGTGPRAGRLVTDPPAVGQGRRGSFRARGGGARGGRAPRDGQRHGIPPRSADRGRGGRCAAVIVPTALTRDGPARPGADRCGRWSGWASSLRVYPLALARLPGAQQAHRAGYPLFAARCAATLGARRCPVADRAAGARWRPVHVPLLRLAGAMAATAVAVTMVVTRRRRGPVPGWCPTCPLPPPRDGAAPPRPRRPALATRWRCSVT